LSTPFTAAEQLRKAHEHCKEQLKGQDEKDPVLIKWALDTLVGLAQQVDTQAESEKKESHKLLDYALKIRQLKYPSLRQRCINAILGFKEAYKPSNINPPMTRQACR
jgi:hypothetical protein